MRSIGEQRFVLILFQLNVLTNNEMRDSIYAHNMNKSLYEVNKDDCYDDFDFIVNESDISYDDKHTHIYIQLTSAYDRLIQNR